MSTYRRLQQIDSPGRQSYQDWCKRGERLCDGRTRAEQSHCRLEAMLLIGRFCDYECFLRRREGKQQIGGADRVGVAQGSGAPVIPIDWETSLPDRLASFPAAGPGENLPFAVPLQGFFQAAPPKVGGDRNWTLQLLRAVPKRGLEPPRDLTPTRS